MNLFYQPLISEGANYLDATESKHSARVLRKRSGDILHVTDGKGFLYHARIVDADISRCTFEVVEKIAAPNRDYSIHIAISPLKSPDRFEWFVEKAIEFGIDQITLTECEHTERTHLKLERLEKIAVSAMKQSLTFTLPRLSGPASFKDVIVNAPATEKFIAFVDPSNPEHLYKAATPGSNYLVMIGPEGDFSSDEMALALHHNFKKVSLGPTRLRTETAGVAACHVLNLVNVRG